MADSRPAASGAQQPIPVVCAIIERGNVFLTARRAPGQSNADFWEFPGGKVHSGETAEAALERELREELGVRIVITTPLPSHVFSYPWITIELIPFVCTLVEGEPFAHEHAEVRWLDAAEALLLSWAPADLPVLRDYLDYRRQCAV
jgi:8-oxo-dGTP diphosphatase